MDDFFAHGAADLRPGAARRTVSQLHLPLMDWRRGGFLIALRLDLSSGYHAGAFHLRPYRSPVDLQDLVPRGQGKGASQHYKVSELDRSRRVAGAGD